MADQGRKDMTDKASEAVKPDSQKSTMEKGQEAVTDYTDKAAGSVQPGQDKSAGQKAMDSTSGGGQDKGMMDKTKDALGMNK